MTDAYAVIGHPIAHSRSPFIHALFAEQTGEPVVYGAIDVVPERFREGVDGFRAEGGRGLNVTVPLKELAFEYADRPSLRASRAGAANTLRFDDDGVFADNTDGPGLVRDLVRNHGVRIAGASLLLLGAGGAARGVLGPLVDESPCRVVVANRTAARAERLADAFRGEVAVEGVGLDAIPGDGFDIVVNATSASLSGGSLPLAAASLAADACCYDMVYAATPTPFLRLARSLGARRLLDGRGMLVEQAAESFFVWRGVRPDTAPVIAALGAALGGR